MLLWCLCEAFLVARGEYKLISSKVVGKNEYRIIDYREIRFMLIDNIALGAQFRIDGAEDQAAFPGASDFLGP